MPTLDDMKCNACEEIKPKDELDRYEGFCFDCHQALEEAGEKLSEAQDKGDDIEEVDPELAKVVAQALKRRDYMKEYNSRPDVAAKRKQYMKGRAEREKMLLKKAREKGML